MVRTVDTIAGGRARARPASRLRDLVVREHVLIAGLALLVFFWGALATLLLGNDSFMTILWGREILHHGIPHANDLTVMSQGRDFVDQQWLAQVAYWALYALGGMRLALLATIALLLLPVAIGAVVARRHGASPIVVLPFVVVPVLDYLSILRAQVFSGVLFVLLLALLAAESRRPSRRVLLAVPLLLVWANLHGAVLQGAALVALLGVVEAVRARRPTLRAATLVVVPWLCVLATPYGLATAGYYRTLISNPILRSIEGEWRPPTFPQALGWAVFVLAAAFAVLAARRPRDLNAFEYAALAFTLFGALLAVRSIPWFAYSCLVLLPPVAERALHRRAAPAAQPIAAMAIALGTTALAAAALLITFTKPASKLTSGWPPAGAAAMRDVLRADARARVFPSYEFPDWLLLTVPESRGRVAYDGFFEVLTHDQLRDTINYLFQVGVDWERPTRGYRLIVLNPAIEKKLVETYDRRPGVRTLYRDKEIIVFDRGARADA
jgi:hypothetical protein